MDFSETPANAQFRNDLRAFLKDELPDWWAGLFDVDERTFPLTRQVCQHLAERGWLTMSWPTEFGGSDSDPWSQLVLREEMWTNFEPRGPQYMNVNFIGPLIMKFGTPDQQARFLVPMSEGRVIWTQGFSEPDAGSDLASVSTRAREVEGGFQVNGSKIWNSYADAPADWCLLVARSDPDSSRARGLSLLLVDMTAPGITVRPIPSLVGSGEFNEIFFDDVFVPLDCLLGEMGQGWSMIMAGLSLERAGVPWYSTVRRFLQELVEYCNATIVDGAPLATHSGVRAQIAELYCRCEAARLMNYHVVSLEAESEDAAVESALAFIHSSLAYQFAAQVGLDTIGPLAVIGRKDPDAPLSGAAKHHWTLSVAATIAGGTVDIQRNIVAQRGLGLPRAS